MTEVADPRSAPTRELGTATLFPVPSWGNLAASTLVTPLEEIPELIWPRSVRETYPRMRNDTQLSGLYRGTTLPIRRYVWGIDPNGADPQLVDQVCAEFNLQPIDQAWKTFQTGVSEPQPRATNRFSFDQLLADALKACYLGHYYFEQIYDVRQDGPAGLNGGWFAHLRKLAPRAPYTISEFYIDPDGGLAAIRQMWQPLSQPPIPVSQLAAFVFDRDPGDWVGRSLFRACFREWVLKDKLLRVDLVNHEKAGGMFAPIAAPDALPAERAALAQVAQAAQVGDGIAWPAGTNPNFIRASGTDVIASINRHDESMAREFLMMFMALGTSSSGGNRALSQSFIDWFAISQETIAIWFRDVFNEHVLEDFADLNYGAAADYVPRLVYRRPEAANPLDTLAQAATSGDQAGTPATGVVNVDGTTVPVAAARIGGRRDAIVLADEDRMALLEAHAEIERDLQPHRRRHAARAATTVQLPDRPLRRQPSPLEARAAVNFKTLDSSWQDGVDELVQQWQTIRAGQIAELVSAIERAGGDLAAITTVQAAVAGGDVIAAHLRAMAHTAAAQAAGEAAAQGAPVEAADLAALERELAARAGALAQVLANSLSQAAQARALQQTGMGLSSTDVAEQVGEYLGSLTDAYLTDQFSGVMSAARTGGRLAVMGDSGASRYYISALLDVNCCEACAADDGAEYTSAADIAAQMPSGFNKDCQGGPRCRCTAVAVYDESAPTDGEASAATAAEIAGHVTRALQTHLSRVDPDPSRIAALVAAAVAPIQADLARVAATVAGQQPEPVDLTAIERQIDELHTAVAAVAATPVPAGVDRAEVQALLDTATHPLELQLANLAGDVRVALERHTSRPRKAVARRAADGALEVTYPEDGEPT